MPFAAGLYYFLNEGGRREKPAVVLIHGIAGSHPVWSAELRHAAGHRLIVPDLPGHGRSGGTGLQSVNAYADQLMEFLASLGLDQAIFVGHDLGGSIAMTLALRYPKSALAIGLISCGAHIALSQELLADAFDPATLPLAIETLDALFSGPDTRSLVSEKIDAQFRETRAGVLYGDLLACSSCDLVNQVAEIEIPTLVLAGTGDRLTPPNYAQYLAMQIGLDGTPKEKGHLALFPWAGHHLLLEQPQWVKEKLMTFLQMVSPN